MERMAWKRRIESVMSRTCSLTGYHWATSPVVKTYWGWRGWRGSRWWRGWGGGWGPEGRTGRSCCCPASPLYTQTNTHTRHSNCKQLQMEKTWCDLFKLFIEAMLMRVIAWAVATQKRPKSHYEANKNHGPLKSLNSLLLKLFYLYSSY